MLNFVCIVVTHTGFRYRDLLVVLVLDLTPGGISIDVPVVRRSLVRIAQMFGLPSSRPTTTTTTA